MSTPIYYDISLSGTGAGDGSSENPFTWDDAMYWGNEWNWMDPGHSNIDFYIRGIKHTSGSIFIADTCHEGLRFLPWDLSLYGPWRIGTDSGTIRFYGWEINGAILKADTIIITGPYAGSLNIYCTVMMATDIYLQQSMENYDTYTCGCSFIATNSITFTSAFSPNTSYYIDCIFEFFSASATNSTDFYNCAMPRIPTCPWDVTNIQFTGKSFADSNLGYSLGIYISPDGLNLYAPYNYQNIIKKFVLGTAWDTTTAIYTNSFTTTNAAWSVWFTSDGLYMYILSAGTTPEINQYVLSVAWDITTATLYSNFSIGGRPNAHGIVFSVDGTKMYITDQAGTPNDAIIEYTLSSPYIVSSASYTSSLSVSFLTNTPYGLYIKDDGLKLYVIGSAEGKVFEYTLSIAWDITTAIYCGCEYVMSNPNALTFKNDGTIMYILNVYPNILIREWNIKVFLVDCQVDWIPTVFPAWDDETKLDWSQSILAVEISTPPEPGNLPYSGYATGLFGETRTGIGALWFNNINIYVNIDNSYTGTGHAGTEENPLSYSDWQTHINQTLINTTYYIKGFQTLTGGGLGGDCWIWTGFATNEITINVLPWEDIPWVIYDDGSVSDRWTVFGSSLCTTHLIVKGGTFHSWAQGEIHVSLSDDPTGPATTDFDSCYFSWDWRFRVYSDSAPDNSIKFNGCTFNPSSPTSYMEIIGPNYPHRQPYLVQMNDCYIGKFPGILDDYGISFYDMAWRTQLLFKRCIFEHSLIDNIFTYPEFPLSSASLTNCEISHVSPLALPLASDATFANKSDFTYTNFRLSQVTDSSIIAEGIAGDYNTGLYGETRLGFGAFYFLPPPPPVASFSYIITGNSVFFMDTSTGSPTSWDWDFGDGSSHSTYQNLTHIYANGTYTASLIVSNSYGSSTPFSQTFTISVPVPFSYGPSIDFLIDYNLTYYASGEPYRGSPNSFFLGVFNIDGIDPKLTDPENGNFTLQNNSPCINAGIDNSDLEPSVPTEDIIGTTRPQDIHTDIGAYEYLPPPPPPPPVKADFSVSIREGFVSLTVIFTATCTGTPIYLRWVFGDGVSVENENNPHHTYIKEGIYSPSLIVRGANNKDVMTKTNWLIVNKVYTESQNIIIESYKNDYKKV